MLTEPSVLIAAGAFVAIFALAARGVIGAVLIGIIGATAVAMGLRAAIPAGHRQLPVPSLAPTFLAMQFDVSTAGNAVLTSILVFLLIDMLDTSGTLTAVAYQGESARRKGQAAERAARADHRRAGHHDRRRARHLARHRLYRKRGGHPGGRAHGTDRGRRRHAVPAQPVP